MKVSLLFRLALNTSNPKSGPDIEMFQEKKKIGLLLLSVVVGGSEVMLELRKASLASFAMSLLSSLSSSINQMDGQTLKYY